MNKVNLSGYAMPQASRDVFHNQQAQALASGDRRYQTKKQQLDRPGMSRSRGTTMYADAGGAQDVANGLANAYTNQLQQASYYSTADLNNRAAQEQFAQSLGALQQQNSYANQMAGLQRNNSMMGVLGGLLR